MIAEVIRFGESLGGFAVEAPDEGVQKRCLARAVLADHDGNIAIKFYVADWEAAPVVEFELF